MRAAGTYWWAPVPVMTAVGVVTAVGLSYLRPLENTFPVYLELAQEMRAGAVSSTFTPLGYPWLIAMVPVESIDVAAKIVHVGCYIALAALIGVWLHSARATPRSIFGIAAGAWILFNPYVLVNLYRVNDNNVTVVGVLALFALLRFAAGTPSPSWPLYAAAGALVAALAFVRPNAVCLFPVVVVAAWLHPRSAPRRLVVPVAVSAVAALVVYSTLSWVVVGAPLFWPGNGPYNLFAGNNPASRAALVVDYNAEPSLPEGLAWCGVAPPIARVTADQFLSCTRKFVAELPVQAMQVTVFKIYNLLWRPNLRLAESPLETAIQYAMVLPSLLWFLASAAIFVRLRRVMDPMATAFVAAFVLPFAFTNSDPRFRLPLDAVLAMSLAASASMAALHELVVPWRPTPKRVSSAR